MPRSLDCTDQCDSLAPVGVQQSVAVFHLYRGPLVPFAVPVLASVGPALIYRGSFRRRRRPGRLFLSCYLNRYSWQPYFPPALEVRLAPHCHLRHARAPTKAEDLLAYSPQIKSVRDVGRVAHGNFPFVCCCQNHAVGTSEIPQPGLKSDFGWSTLCGFSKGGLILFLLSLPRSFKHGWLRFDEGHPIALLHDNLQKWYPLTVHPKEERKIRRNGPPAHFNVHPVIIDPLYNPPRATGNMHFGEHNLFSPLGWAAHCVGDGACF